MGACFVLAVVVYEVERERGGIELDHAVAGSSSISGEPLHVALAHTLI